MAAATPTIPEAELEAAPAEAPAGKPEAAPKDGRRRPWGACAAACARCRRGRGADAAPQPPEAEGGGRLRDRVVRWLQELTFQHVVVRVLGVGAATCFLAAVLLSPPNLFAAGLAAVLGALSLYAHALQMRCERLSPAPFAEVPLDLAAYTRALTAPHGAPEPTGPATQLVLVKSLVNEHLRCLAALKRYQDTFGRLVNAPECDPERLEAMLGVFSKEFAAGKTADLSPSRRGAPRGGRAAQLDLDAVAVESPATPCTSPSKSPSKSPSRSRPVMVLGGLSAGTAKSIEDLDVSKDYTPMFGPGGAAPPPPAPAAAPAPAPAPAAAAPVPASTPDDTADLPLWLRQIQLHNGSG